MPEHAIKNTELPVSEDFPDKAMIWIKGARSNNLKDIEVRIPKNRLIVVTGLSGSGKSSLIMDTLYAEGQRRYVESLSSYARQFLTRMKKPEVDFIKGICPAIAIEQKVSNRNSRSTVGSMTEIYDLLRLLYARIGKTISPLSGQPVKKHTVSDVVDYFQQLPDGTRVVIYAPFNQQYGDRSLRQELNVLLQKGYTRVMEDDEMVYIEDILANGTNRMEKPLREVYDHYRTLIDRVVVKSGDEENTKRIADSILTAFDESEGVCEVAAIGYASVLFSNRFELDGMEFPEPSPQLFNYNNPYGACPRCEGYGRIIGIDKHKVIPDHSRSVYEGAIACWSGEKSERWLHHFLLYAKQIDFPIHRAVRDLTDKQYELLWTGNEYFKGINAYFAGLKEKTYKIQNRVILARYRGRTNCPECDGSRLRMETTYVKIQGKHLGQLIDIPIENLHKHFQELELDDHDRAVAKRLLIEIGSRLDIMVRIGLGYLTLDRTSASLSGGETQRINLTRTLGSNLSDSLYILDEPSIGLHPKDTEQLVSVLRSLRDLGNTVVVVEHEEEVIRSADHIIEMGPGAGIYGGDVVYIGPFSDFLTSAAGHLTAEYLSGKKSIQLPERRRQITNQIIIRGAKHHNLQDIDVNIPLHALTVISGVSGSGKTTLVKHILYPALRKRLGLSYSRQPGDFYALEGDLDMIDQLEYISQNPIGRSSRSNPVTYIKAYDAIRKLMVNQQLSRIRGYKPKHFSFNVEGGRCETCKGDGMITIEMQFLADVQLVCDECKGKRFTDEILEVTYHGKTIYDILNLSIAEAIDFFEDQPSIVSSIRPLMDVGLGYVKMGQPSSTLSGGEAQRVKLAYYLSKENMNEHILFIFDEPTTGLHFHDINKLLSAINALIEQGHSVLIIEHNMEVIKSADWLIDLGPGGGHRGGRLLYQGPPEGITACQESHTAEYLTQKL